MNKYLLKDFSVLFGSAVFSDFFYLVSYRLSFWITLVFPPSSLLIISCPSVSTVALFSSFLLRRFCNWFSVAKVVSRLCSRSVIQELAFSR
ncbi:Uncharacterized protein APZ42_024979 [Daphnia magna]|uniref:Uncharacterized protein n=1 Tax=Daphnia magna TaxID=35525 RepID=A0A0P6CGI0_9CRUS|nr:Uncharacterized protein APZ42_024979 [Daphnia magna]